MVKTTTCNIKLTDEGIVINQFFSRSGFKKNYVFEQNHTIKFLGKEKRKPILIDLTIIPSTLEEIRRLISYENFNIIKSLAIVVRSTTQQIFLSLWYKIMKVKFPIQFFTRKDEAQMWLKAYC